MSSPDADSWLKGPFHSADIRSMGTVIIQSLGKLGAGFAAQLAHRGKKSKQEAEVVMNY